MTSGALIINPVSGRGLSARQVAESAAMARRVLASAGVEADVEVTRGAGDARRLTAEAVAGGARLVIVWGGDGTINEAGSVLLSSAIPLGIVAAGSGNGLARDLGVPSDVPAALITAATGTTRAIDAGRMDGRAFFNVAGIGLDARVADRFASGARRGLRTYLAIAARELWRAEPREYAVTVGSATCSYNALMIAFANSRQFGNGALIAPRARLDDGTLEMVVVTEQPLWRIARRVPPLFRGTLAEGPGLTMRSIGAASVEAPGAMPFHIDGEPCVGRDRIQVEVMPRALRVRVPVPEA